MSPEEAQAAAEVLLQDVAVNLTVLAGLGVRVRLRHNAVITDAGYVLWAGDDEGWVARTLAYLPLDQPDPLDSPLTG